MRPLDWTIVFFFLALLTLMACYTRRYVKGVADFLVANRCAGRYILAMADGASGLGAISIIGWFEMYYVGGFTPVWWAMMMMPTSIIIALSGWIVYRYRQTRAMTLAQFFEMRYSKNFRVFAGCLAFGSGILNFGIFPAVSAKFLLYFCRLPQTVHVLYLDISTYVALVAGILTVSLLFTFAGGQITIMVTDFLQGLFCNFIFIILILFIINKFGWHRLSQTLLNAPADASMINPLHTSKIPGFNFWFFLIGVFGQFYGTMAWQGSQGFQGSAKSPHEARMAKILGNWRAMTSILLFVLAPIAVYVLLNNGVFAADAAHVKSILAGISDEKAQNQLRVPIALTQILPAGLVGAMCAMMIAATLATHQAYMHSWGSILIQDVIMPLRSKTFEPREHIKILRWSIFGVAAFVFFFSVFFRQTDYILMYFAITGAVYLGGAGSVIIGGLYWSRGTTAAAWAAMITGSSLAVGGLIIRQIDAEFFINSQWMWFIAMISSIAAYILVSLAGKTQRFDMDSLLNRSSETADLAGRKVNYKQWIFEKLGITNEFTKGDKIIYFAGLIWTLSWFTVFCCGTIYNLFNESSDHGWLTFWHIWLWISLGSGLIFTMWFALGGFRDMHMLFKTLISAERNVRDDGRVYKNKGSVVPIKNNREEHKVVL